MGPAATNRQRFFDKYKDPHPLWTDATPHGDETPQQVFNDKLYEIYYRFLETGDEYFDARRNVSIPKDAGESTGLSFPDNSEKSLQRGNAPPKITA